MYLPLALLFLILIIIGSFLTFLLFGFNLRALRESGLDKKIMMWVPFAVIFLLILYLGSAARFLVLSLVLLMAVYEFLKVYKQQADKLFLRWYFALFIFGFLHLGLIRLIVFNSSNLLLYLIVGTVVSDVCGFFFGSFFGWHKLPEKFNKRKSWEGVVGQFAGALLGVFLIKHYILFSGNLLLFLPIGLGSAAFDLLNSRAKRIANIRNWSNFIPGHGGFIDRFCSLAGSSLLTFYFIWLISSR